MTSIIGFRAAGTPKSRRFLQHSPRRGRLATRQSGPNGRDPATAPAPQSFTPRASPTTRHSTARRDHPPPPWNSHSQIPLPRAPRPPTRTRVADPPHESSADPQHHKRKTQIAFEASHAPKPTNHPTARAAGLDQNNSVRYCRTDFFPKRTEIEMKPPPPPGAPDMPLATPPAENLPKPAAADSRPDLLIIRFAVFYRKSLN